MDILQIFNEEDVAESELKTYRIRRAARIVAVDADKNIAILHVVRDDFYELPGGGVDPEETFEQGAVRESKEEIGCDIEILSPIGMTLEYRKKLQMVNESHGFLSNIIGEKGQQQLEQDEHESKMEVVWVSPQEAIDLIKTSIPKDLYDEYVMKRDIAFITEAIAFIS